MNSRKEGITKLAEKIRVHIQQGELEKVAIYATAVKTLKSVNKLFRIYFFYLYIKHLF